MLKSFLTFALILTSTLSYAGIKKDCKTEDADPSTYSKVSAAPIAKTSLEELKSNFNRDKNSVRVVTLLSPTCRYCQSGQAVVKDLFSKYSSKNLKGYVVENFRPRPGFGCTNSGRRTELTRNSA